MPLHRRPSFALIKTMSDLFSTVYYAKKKKKKKWVLGEALAYKMHDGARPKLCTVYCYLTWVTLFFRVKCDAKRRLQSQSESHVLQTAPPPAFSCQAHLDCFTCAGDPVVRCRAVRVEPSAGSKKSGVQQRRVKKRGLVRGSARKSSSPLPNGGSAWPVCLGRCESVSR